MTTFDAREIIRERLRVAQDYKEQIPDYFEALTVADEVLTRNMMMIDYVCHFATSEQGALLKKYIYMG